MIKQDGRGDSEAPSHKFLVLFFLKTTGGIVSQEEPASVGRTCEKTPFQRQKEGGKKNCFIPVMGR